MSDDTPDTPDITTRHLVPTRHILMVCTANVCRSFMAEVVLRHRAERSGLALVVSSAGTRMPGLPADPDAVQALTEIGIEVPHHRPRQLDRGIIRADGADLVVTMTREHLRDVVAMDRSAWPRTFTLRELVRRASALPDRIDDWEEWLAALATGRSARDMMTPEPSDDIADPYGRSMAEHRECLTLTRGLLDQLVSLSPLGAA